jgi:3-carboxy-cis,cis-muconate cycloisomerase
MPPSSSLFERLFGAPDVDAELTATAWLRALLDVERELAAAQAEAGLIPAEAAREIGRACAVDLIDATAIAERSAASGNPVVPLVSDLRRLVPRDAAQFVHLGATSQDIVDTALSLIARRATAPILSALAGAADACAALARSHASTPMSGRTLLQQAAPVTFGLKAAGWLVAIDEAAADLRRIREGRLAVQYGGAVGTLAAVGDAGTTVLRLLAQRLDLAEPTMPWHTNRSRIGELASSLGVVSGVLGKVALDVLLLAQSEVAEAAEPSGDGRGGSSAMPHKANPVRAVLVTANARRVPGLVATVLAAMPQEHERAAGAWHAEWETVTELLRLLGGAATGTHELVKSLRVDPGRMRENLDRSGGLLLTENVTARLAPAIGRAQAHELVARLSRDAVEQRVPLREVLLSEPQVCAHLSTEDLDAALDPAGYLGSTREFIERALAAHAAGGGRDG